MAKTVSRTNPRQTKVPAQQFSFYAKLEYFRDITERIAQTPPGGRVALATMDFEPDEPVIRRLIDELVAAAKRGVRVSLAIDAITFIQKHNHVTQGLGPLFYHANLTDQMEGIFQRRMQALERLRAAGGRYAITNQPARRFTNPKAGRSHIKFAIINDGVYIGGCNLRSPNEINLMVSWESAKTANWLYDFAENMLAHEGESFMDGQDRSFAIDPHTKLLVDAGKRRQSATLDKALELIDQAEQEVLITCQYFPGGATAKHLLAAKKRGVAVRILYNRPASHGGEAPLHYLYNGLARTQLPSEFFKDRLPKSSTFLHAKLITSEKAAIIGSHNYVQAGVNFGTAEIALLRRDPEFSRSALRALRQQLPSY
jgi:phosphatidylserine/phosphatidylglycerophosphate/cardiolipin synthase-like enzyme